MRDNDAPIILGLDWPQDAEAGAALRVVVEARPEGVSLTLTLEGPSGSLSRRIGLAAFGRLLRFLEGAHDEAAARDRLYEGWVPPRPCHKCGERPPLGVGLGLRGPCLSGRAAEEDAPCSECGAPESSTRLGASRLCGQCFADLMEPSV